MEDAYSVIQYSLTKKTQSPFYNTETKNSGQSLNFICESHSVLLLTDVLLRAFDVLQQSLKYIRAGHIFILKPVHFTFFNESPQLHRSFNVLPFSNRYSPNLLLLLEATIA